VQPNHKKVGAPARTAPGAGQAATGAPEGQVNVLVAVRGPEDIVGACTGNSAYAALAGMSRQGSRQANSFGGCRTAATGQCWQARQSTESQGDIIADPTAAAVASQPS